MQRDFQSFTGPGDRDLPMSEISGYQPVSRIGEIVMNAFIDSYEFSALKDQLNGLEMTGRRLNGTSDSNALIPTEYKPMFHEWATVQPGMVCLARKKKTAVFRQYVAAETAVPVVACAACLPVAQEKDYFFAGVARSASVRGPDDGIGPTTDEFFTVSIGGMVTVLNTSGTQIHPGDLVEWCLINPAAQKGQSQKRLKTGPRRIGIRSASVSSSKVIGRALSFAKSGETLDVLMYARRLTRLPARLPTRITCAHTHTHLVLAVSNRSGWYKVGPGQEAGQVVDCIDRVRVDRCDFCHSIEFVSNKNSDAHAHTRTHTHTHRPGSYPAGPAAAPARLICMTGLAASRSSRKIIAAVWLSASCMVGTARFVIACAPSTMLLAPIDESSTCCNMDMVRLIAFPK